MIDIKELLLDMGYGFKKIFMAIGGFLLAMSIIWGITSALITILGVIKFQWWNIPFWILIVCTLALCIGRDGN